MAKTSFKSPMGITMLKPVVYGTLDGQLLYADGMTVAQIQSWSKWRCLQPAMWCNPRAGLREECGRCVVQGNVEWEKIDIYIEL